MKPTILLIVAFHQTYKEDFTVYMQQIINIIIFHKQHLQLLFLLQTAQIAWQDSECEALVAIFRELLIDAQHSQGIVKGREYLIPQEYKRAKRQQEEQIDEELQPLKNELEEYKQLRVSGKAFVVNEKKVPFSKNRVSVAKEDLEKLKKQAKAQRINQSEIKTLREKNITLDKYQFKLDEHSKSLDEQEQKLEKDRQIVRNDYQAVKEMYYKQCNINGLLERSEACVSVLTDKNLSLSRAVDNQAKTIQELHEQITQRSI